MDQTKVEGKLFSVIEEQNRRIEKLEREIASFKKSYAKSPHLANFSDDNLLVKETKKNRKTKTKFKFNFTSFITVTGILGLIVGLVSFFVYAIANKWIGPLGQISIGMLVGLVLFFCGYTFYNQYRYWSLSAFGGAIVVEYLSIGFGVWYYQIIDPTVAFIGLTIFTALGLMLAIRYDSLLIAYFGIAGGFLTPLVANVSSVRIMFLFLLVLAGGVLLLSYTKKWTSLRLVSYLLLVGYEFTHYTSFGAGTPLEELSPTLSLVFLTIFFFLYNLSTIIYPLRLKEVIASVDVFTLNLNTFLSSILATKIILWGTEAVSKKVLGLVFIGLSFFFITQVYSVRKFASEKSSSVVYSLLTSGVLAINAGLILVFSTGDILKFVLLSLPQWVLYMILASQSKEEDRTFYKIFGYIFLTLSVLWFASHLTLDEVLSRATFIVIAMMVFLLVLYALVWKNVEKALHGTLLVLSGFAFSYSFIEYLGMVFVTLSYYTRTTLLSAVWLMYSLLLFIKTRHVKEQKMVKQLAFALLIAALCKIAFYDLWQLTELTRIVGFTIFGILLLVGGWRLKND